MIYEVLRAVILSFEIQSLAQLGPFHFKIVKMSLETKKDIARFFSMSGLRVAPDAADGLLAELRRLQHHDEKQRYMDKFVHLFKEFQQLTSKSAQSAGADALGVVGPGSVLDANIAAKIVASQAMQGFDPRVAVQKSSVSFQRSGSRGRVDAGLAASSATTSFKKMKEQAKLEKQQHQRVDRD